MTGTNGRGWNQRWPEQDEIDLRKYWEVDKLTATQIVTVMGNKYTRSAVLGKVNRLKLSARGSTGNKVPRKKRQTNFNFTLGRAKRSKVMIPKPVIKPLLEITPLNGVGITILELTACHCHAVVKEHERMSGNLALYCGHPVVEGEAYCVDHYVAFHQPPRPRQARPPVPRFR